MNLTTNQKSASLQPLTTFTLNTAFPSTSENVAHFLTLGSDQIQEK
jgi:hypothetical protein